MSDAQLERLADLVAARLRQPAASAPEPMASLQRAALADGGGDRLVSAAALARELGVSRAFVYAHAAELGAIRLGEGPRAHLRFDPEGARAALACYGSERSQPQTPSVGAASAPRGPRRRRSLATDRPQPGSILPARPRRRREAAS